MDKELIAYLDERFRETSRQIQGHREETTQQIASLREETTQRLERVENTSHETRILLEHLHGEIKLVAEGVVAVGERLDTSVAELKQDINEVRSLFTVHNKNLDGRVQVVEERTARHTREIAALRRRSDKARPRPT